MKTRATLAVLMVFAQAGCGMIGIGPDRARAEVEARTRAYGDSLLAGPEATAAFYAGDGEMVVGTTRYRGPGAVRDFLAPLWQQADLAEPRMLPQAVEVYGDTAYVWGTYVQRAAPKGQPLKEYKGSFVIKWRRGSDGRWLIARLMTNP